MNNLSTVWPEQGLLLVGVKNCFGRPELKMDGEEDEMGWDGPNIRPPPLKHESGNRNRFGSDRRHQHGPASHSKQHHGSDRPSSRHQRSDRSSSRQLESRPGQSRGRDGRDRRPPVEDLRGRIGQPKGPGSDYKRSSSSREKDRPKNRGHQVRVQGPTNPTAKYFNLTLSLTCGEEAPL